MEKVSKKASGARKSLVEYLKNDKFYQVTDGEMLIDKSGNTVSVDLSSFKKIAEGFIETRRVIGVVLNGQVFIVPNTPSNYLNLKSVLFPREELSSIPYLHGEHPVIENSILSEIL